MSGLTKSYKLHWANGGVFLLAGSTTLVPTVDPNRCDERNFTMMNGWQQYDSRIGQWTAFNGDYRETNRIFWGLWVAHCQSQREQREAADVPTIEKCLASARSRKYCWSFYVLENGDDYSAHPLDLNTQDPPEGFAAIFSVKMDNPVRFYVDAAPDFILEEQNIRNILSNKFASLVRSKGSRVVQLLLSKNQISL